MYLSRSQVREIDHRATAEYGIPSLTLMENAGRGCAEMMMQLNLEKKPVWILCGPGNNGGDGFVIARHLAETGSTVRIALFDEPNQLSRDAAINYRLAIDNNIMIQPIIYNTNAWYIDALFGTGLSRHLQPPHSDIVEQLNQFGHPILAIDIPSGLDCDTGEPLGPCVKAMHTATFVAPKLGYANPKSKEFTGEVHVIDIGVPRKLIDDVLKASGAA